MYLNPQVTPSAGRYCATKRNKNATDTPNLNNLSLADGNYIVNSSNLPSNPFDASKIVIVKIEHWWDSYIVQTALCFGQGNDYLAQRKSVDGGSYSAWKKIVLG